MSEMRVNKTFNGFATVTFSKLMKDRDILYSENGAAIIKSPKLDVRLSEPADFGESPESEDGMNFFQKRRRSWKDTQNRIDMGEPTPFVIYTPLEDEQKLTVRSCFPGTILEWDCGRDGDIYAIEDSFLIAEIGAIGKSYNTRNKAIRNLSGTNDKFQHFSGTGKVFFEVHGDLVEIPLYSHESVQIRPGYFLAMTEGIKMEMVGVGDVQLRTSDNTPLWLQLTAGEKEGKVFCHSVIPREFMSKCK